MRLRRPRWTRRRTWPAARRKRRRGPPRRPRARARPSGPPRRRHRIEGANGVKLFPFGHATHPQWQMAVGLVLAQLRAQMALPDYARSPTLGLLYITDRYA